MLSPAYLLAGVGNIVSLLPHKIIRRSDNTFFPVNQHVETIYFSFNTQIKPNECSCSQDTLKTKSHAL